MASRASRRGKHNRKAKNPRRKSITKWAIASMAIVFIIVVGSLWISSRPTYTPASASVGIIDQFYLQSPQFTDEAEKLLNSHGLSVDAHEDIVTVDLYRKLPSFGYKIIILRVHAGVAHELEGNPPYLFTTEPYSTSKYGLEQLTNRVMIGVLSLQDPTESPVFVVSPMFVTSSMQGDFNGAIIILSSCYGMYSDQLAAAFVAKGAKAFIGWNDEVDLDHTDRATLRILKALIIEKSSIEEAVAKATKDVGPDPTYGSRLSYYPSERGNLTLVSSPPMYVSASAAMAMIPLIFCDYRYARRP